MPDQKAIDAERKRKEEERKRKEEKKKQRKETGRVERTGPRRTDRERQEAD